MGSCVTKEAGDDYWCYEHLADGKPAEGVPMPYETSSVFGCVGYPTPRMRVFDELWRSAAFLSPSECFSKRREILDKFDGWYEMRERMNAEDQ